MAWIVLGLVFLTLVAFWLWLEGVFALIERMQSSADRGSREAAQATRERGD